MRTGTLSLLLFCLLIALHSTATAQALTDKDAGKLIDEYVAVATSDSRRNDLEKKLLTAKPSLTAKNIKSAFGVDKKRANALALATKLWTPARSPPSSATPIQISVRRSSGLGCSVRRKTPWTTCSTAGSSPRSNLRLSSWPSTEGFKTTFIDCPTSTRSRRLWRSQKMKHARSLLRRSCPSSST